uniref:ATP synthase F0 subunit 8 n=1 Tax=Gramastacus lacus TaxID=1501715 RepID=A0A060VD33_9EUCA|nr:ATP synthase F0 subunit 8 [Gramastacus lacus]CDQ51975.1 ATP synthase F0 subunit 8 [Gramastacus lacus]
MPQMSPLLWLNLYMFFLLSFLLFLVVNYFFNQTSKKQKLISDFSINQKPWKW